MLKDEQYCPHNGGRDAGSLKTRSYFSYIQYEPKYLFVETSNLQIVTGDTGICFIREIVNHTSSVPKKTTFRPFLLYNHPRLLASQNTMIGTTKVQIFCITNQNTMTFF